MKDIKPVLKVENLQTFFHTKKGVVKAVNGVSFHINPGKTLAIVGESGSGKSVTSMSILKLVDEPGKIEAGKIILNNDNITEYISKIEAISDPEMQLEYAKEVAVIYSIKCNRKTTTEKIIDELRLRENIDLVPASEKIMQSIRGNTISMIFQEPMTALNPVLTIGYQLSEVFMLHQGMKKKEALRESEKMIEMVGIPNAHKIIGMYPHQLSGGMKQRIVIAIALACEPKLLIADEPTTALDVTIQAQILKLMNELKAVNNTAILFITHDLGVVAQVADEVVVMYAGQAIEQAAVDIIFTSDSTYSHPYRHALLESIPKLTETVEKLATIKGEVPHPLDLPTGCKFAPRCKFAKEICQNEEPKLQKVAPDHFISCHFPVTAEREGGKA